MELIHHIYANATFSREYKKQSSLENLASNQKNFQIVKERHGLMRRAIPG